MMFVRDHFKDEKGEDLKFPEVYEAVLGHESAGRQAHGPTLMLLRVKEISEKWKNAPADVKAVYRDRFARLKEEYKKRYEAWEETVSEEQLDTIQRLETSSRCARTARRKRLNNLIEPVEEKSSSGSSTSKPRRNPAPPDVSSGNCDAHMCSRHTVSCLVLK